MSDRPLPAVTVRVIPHDQQRYDTTGDYVPAPAPAGAPSAWEVRVSDLGSGDFAFLVALHELVEWWWAQQHGIPNAVIDDFDRAFERERHAGGHGPDAEPGDDPRCPVYHGHQLASALERVAAALLGIDWLAYTAAFDALPAHPSTLPREATGRTP